jgi:class 3 adenylate cyclase
VVEATFVFLDLAGFTALTETHGDEAAATLIDRFSALVKEACGTDARLVSLIGDAAFLVARAPGDALRMLERVLLLARAEPDFPALRAGLHHGEAAEREGQFYGTAVNIAARLTAQAGGGQVVSSETIVGAAQAAGLSYRSLGHVRLKNLREPLELFALTIGSSDVSEAIDPVCRMRVVRERAGAHLELAGAQYWFCSSDCLRIFLRQDG